MSADFYSAIDLVYERTGRVLEVETVLQLAEAMLEWGEEIAAENYFLRERLLKSADGLEQVARLMRSFPSVERTDAT